MAKMTYKEKMDQERAYRDYQKSLAEDFAQSEDGEFEISQEQSQEWRHLRNDLQMDEMTDSEE